MIRVKLVLLFTLLSDSIIGQEKINGVWQNPTEDYIYDIYQSNLLYSITDYTSSSYPEGGINLTTSYYGFYKNCNPPQKDSLNMNINGLYFRISLNGDFLNPVGVCPELRIWKKKDSTFLTFYYSSRQQWVTYKKMKKLPTKLERFLKKEHIAVYKDYLHSINGREITTTKTYIYTAPNLKGKMYLLKGDIVTVLEEEKYFVKFEYETDKERIITGYLKKEDLE